MSHDKKLGFRPANAKDTKTRLLDRIDQLVHDAERELGGGNASEGGQSEG